MGAVHLMAMFENLKKRIERWLDDRAVANIVKRNVIMESQKED